MGSLLRISLVASVLLLAAGCSSDRADSDPDDEAGASGDAGTGVDSGGAGARGGRAGATGAAGGGQSGAGAGSNVGGAGRGQGGDTASAGQSGSGGAIGGRGGGAGDVGKAGASGANAAGAAGMPETICVPAFTGGACVDEGYLYCGSQSGGSCCPPAVPYFCAEANQCFATAEQAAAACPDGACSACVSQATGTCGAAPTGGSCVGLPGYLFCGGICCKSSQPYYCATSDLCYSTPGQAATACAEADCMQCSPTCSAPPAASPAGGVDGICGNEEPLAVIDGIPAYEMCDAALEVNVWSNNGAATAASSQGEGWVETQTGVVGTTAPGGYQCTELATRYFYFKFGICPWISGYAKDMCDGPLPAGVVTTTAPMHGDLVIITPGCDGSDSVTGHVAVVDEVEGTMVSAVQQHSGSAGVGTYSMGCVTCFLHATANTGTP